MKFNVTSLQGVFLIDLETRQDDRGSFVRTFCKKEFSQISFSKEFVQMNQSNNKKAGTFRGFHYQRFPFAETKLVRCVQGSVIDIVVDLRQGSPTFLQNFQAELSCENGRMLLIPEGVAHGFITLEDDTSLLYHHTEYYHPESEGALNVHDPRICLSLPEAIRIISEKDKTYPFLADDFRGLALHSL